MIITCPACSTRYEVPETSVGAEGRIVRCAKCRNDWFQPGPGAMAGTDALAEAPPGAEPGSTEPDAATEAEQTEIDIALPAERDPARPEAFASAPAADDSPAVPPSAPPEPHASTADDGADAENLAYYADEPLAPPRRNRLKGWIIAVLLFVLLALGIAAAAVRNGLPEWVPLSRSTFAEQQPGLVLDFPQDRIDRRTLPDGTEYFGARGTITNVGPTRRSVPTVLIVLRDQQQRIVYKWEVIPPRRQLAPGETMVINEAVTDIPRTAIVPEIGWKAG